MSITGIRTGAAGGLSSGFLRRGSTCRNGNVRKIRVTRGKRPPNGDSTTHLGSRFFGHHGPFRVDCLLYHCRLNNKRLGRKGDYQRRYQKQRGSGIRRNYSHLSAAPRKMRVCGQPGLELVMSAAVTSSDCEMILRQRFT
jgi:hypothetical protein